MNKNSLRNKPTPTAPALTATNASSGCSIFANNSTFSPSRVTADVLSKRDNLPRSSSPWRCLKLYSAKIIGLGSTMTTPASPSMITQSSCRIKVLAARAPTTAGIFILRATMAVCEVLPPTSVTNPANTLCLNCNISAGDKSCATKIKGTSTVSANNKSCCPERCLSSRLSRRLCDINGAATPCIYRKIRSTTCSKSAFRSRK